MHKEELANGVTREKNVEMERTDQSRTRACDAARRRRYLVNILVSMFGIGTCVGLNGIAAEFPLLVLSAPEGSALPSYVAFAATTAYVGPAIYALVNKSTSQLQTNNMVACIYSLLILGTVAMGLLAFFHDVTTTIFAVERSAVQLILTFILAFTAGWRNILPMPYLKNVGEVNLSSFFIGEGLSGFIPSIAALIQGVGGDPVCPNNITNAADQPVPYIPPPNFSSRAYFLFVTAIIAASAGSFWLLEYLKVPSLPSVEDVRFHHDGDSAAEPNSSSNLLDQKRSEKTAEIGLIDAADLTLTKPAVTSENGIGKAKTIYLCALMWLACLVANGYLNTIEAYSSRPYGNSVYHLVANLCQLAGTAAYALAFWIPPISTRSITGIMGVVMFATAYVTWLALCSPMPPWRGTTHGVVLLIMIWIILISLVSYAKLAITAIVWQQTSDAGLYQLAFANLTGSICGTFLVFYLVNFTPLFTPYAACELHG